MRNLLKNTSIFIILAFSFSSLISCSSTVTSQKGANDETNITVASNTATSEKTTEASKYPPAPTGIMTAQVKGLDGSLFKFEDHKGKVVLLNLWATWCGPCRKEMPELVAMETEYKDKNFKIFGLNVDDESTDDIKKFVDEMKLNYQIAYADEPLMREFIKLSKQSGIPQSFLIDREGRLRGVFFGGSNKVIAQLRENVDKVVKE